MAWVARHPALTPFHGAQDSPVPVKNGCIPGAPDGEHSTQAGTLPEGARTAVPEAAPVVACDDEADRAVLAVDGVVRAEVVPVAVLPLDGAVPEAPVVGASDAADVDCVAAPGLAVAGEAVAPGVLVLRVTTPFGVTLPGVAGV
jgi:hypothetical protein